MAAVDVIVVHGHSGWLNRPADRGSEGMWQAECVCGWKSPKYPPNDEGTARSGLDAHCLNANGDSPLESNFFTELISSENRRPGGPGGPPNRFRRPVLWRGL